MLHVVRASGFIVIVIMVLLIGGVAGYIFGTHQYSSLGTTPLKMPRPTIIHITPATGFAPPTTPTNTVAPLVTGSPIQ